MCAVKQLFFFPTNNQFSFPRSTLNQRANQFALGKDKLEKSLFPS